MKQSAWRQDNPNFIRMYHGHLEINVPRRMFRNGTSELVEEEVQRFKATLSSRYPWLSVYALDEVVREAQEAMADHIESQKTAVQRAREHMAAQRYREALHLLEDHLVQGPDDADAWYAAAEALFKLGRDEEAFRAMSRARDLAKRVIDPRRGP